jgi:hypothetical protein
MRVEWKEWPVLALRMDRAEDQGVAEVDALPAYRPPARVAAPGEAVQQIAAGRGGSGREAATLRS